jgi:hypothetical protein
MVPAAYYAHLVAARAKCHENISDNESRASGSSGLSSTLERVVDEISASMFCKFRCSNFVLVV